MVTKDNAMQKWHALLFAYGQKEDGSLLPQTMSRCDKAAELYRQGLIEQLYITAHPSRGGQAMADEMKNFLIAHGVPSGRVTVERRAGNTAGELSVFASLVPANAHIVLISSWYHLPRIFGLAEIYFPKRHIRIEAAYGHVNPVLDVLMEVPKFANSMLRPRASAKVLPTPPAIQ